MTTLADWQAGSRRPRARRCAARAPRRGRRASLRRVPFPAVRLMLWLAGRGAPPALQRGGTPVLVAPDHRGWIRPATEAEAAVWHWLAMDRPHTLAPDAWAEPIATLRG